MKAINYSIALLFTVCIAATALAQEYKIPVQNTKDGKIIIKDFTGNLPIEGYSGNEIIITVDKYEKEPDRAKGLKAIYSAGTDNTGIGVSLEKNGNQVTLQCILPITKPSAYKIKVPDNFSVNVQRDCGHHGALDISNIKGEIEAQNCQDIHINNVSGALVLSTVSGDIQLEFGELPKDRPLSIASISGDIDITLPSTVAANVLLQSITGKIYSNFDFPNTSKGDMKQIGGSNTIKGLLNGGGTDINILNTSGNIYLRKK